MQDETAKAKDDSRKATVNPQIDSETTSRLIVLEKMVQEDVLTRIEEIQKNLAATSLSQQVL